MGRITFIDPDKMQLDAFGNQIAGRYDYTSVWWPIESPKLFSQPAPELFVSNLYIPELTGTSASRTEDAKFTAELSLDAVRCFERISENLIVDSASLGCAAQAVDAAFEVLERQRSCLGYSTNHGLALLRKLRGLYPEVPVVFYSHVVAPDDALSAIREGAADVICSAQVTNAELIARLLIAEQHHSKKGSIDTTSATAAPRSESTGSIDAVPASLQSDRWLGSGAKAAESWFGAIAKFIGIGTALLTFLLTAGKLLAWYREMISKHAALTGQNSRIGTLAVLVGWYLVVHFLFISGGILQRLFGELLNGASWLVRRIPRLRKSLSDDTILRGTRPIPDLFRTAWDSCVLVLAVVPALRYTVALIVGAVAG